jgi:hypothetical protein
MIFLENLYLSTNTKKSLAELKKLIDENFNNTHNLAIAKKIKNLKVSNSTSKLIPKNPSNASRNDSLDVPKEGRTDSKIKLTTSFRNNQGTEMVLDNLMELKNNEVRALAINFNRFHQEGRAIA